MKTRTDTEIWNWTSETALEKIDLCELFQLVQQAKRSVMLCLQELLEKGGSSSECQSAASAIATLTELGRRVHQETPIPLRSPSVPGKTPFP